MSLSKSMATPVSSRGFLKTTGHHQRAKIPNFSILTVHIISPYYIYIFSRLKKQLTPKTKDSEEMVTNYIVVGRKLELASISK